MNLAAIWPRLKAWLLDWRSHAFTLLGMLVVVVLVGLWQTRHVPTGPAPAFSAPQAGAAPGGTLTLEEWRARHPGRAVALYFWAEWCPICRLEEGSISALQADWPVLTIALRSGDAARVSGVLRQRTLGWTTLVDADGSLAQRYGAHAVPAFIVLDARGHIRFAEIGYTTALGMHLRLWWADVF